MKWDEKQKNLSISRRIIERKKKIGNAHLAVVENVELHIITSTWKL
jgi:hypothetical protein